MLKTLAVLAAVILGLTVYVSVQNQRAAEQAVHQADQKPKAGAPSLGHEEPQENTKNPQRNPPGWYRFFTWPDGMTTWAILLTLWAIAWQSNETKKAAQASRDSVALFLAKERARLTIKIGRYAWQKAGFGTYEPGPIMEFIVANLGPTHAFDCRLFVSYLPSESEAPVQLPEMKEIETRRTMKAQCRDSHPPLSLELNDVQAIINGRAFLQVAGKLTYTDVFGEDRETTIRCIFSGGKWTRQGQPEENHET